MPVQLGREGTAGERMKQEIALVGQVLDPGGDIDLRCYAINGADVGDEIALEALVRVADAVAIVDRPEQPARVTRRAGQRQPLGGAPGGDERRLAPWHLRDELALCGGENRVRRDPGIGQCE